MSVNGAYIYFCDDNSLNRIDASPEEHLKFIEIMKKELDQLALGYQEEIDKRCPICGGTGKVGPEFARLVSEGKQPIIDLAPKVDPQAPHGRGCSHVYGKYGPDWHVWHWYNGKIVFVTQSEDAARERCRSLNQAEQDTYNH